MKENRPRKSTEKTDHTDRSWVPAFAGMTGHCAAVSNRIPRIYTKGGTRKSAEKDGKNTEELGSSLRWNDGDVLGSSLRWNDGAVRNDERRYTKPLNPYTPEPLPLNTPAPLTNDLL